MAEFLKDLHVQLKVGADFAEAEAANAQAVERIKQSQVQAVSGGTGNFTMGATTPHVLPPAQGPLSSAYSMMGNAGPSAGMSAELANGQVKDLFRELIKALEGNTNAKKDGTGGSEGSPAGAGGAPPIEGGAPGITGPAPAGGIFGRNSLHSWEVQRAMNDPMGFASGAIMGPAMAKAGRLAMMESGGALGEIGAAGSIGLIGGALYGGYKIGDMINQGTLSAGEREVQKRMRDATLSSGVGLDFRGLTFSKDRLKPADGLSDNFNYDYAREGLQGLGVHLGDMGDADRAGMPAFMSRMGQASNQMGVSRDGTAGFMGQLWASGAGEKTLSGSQTILEKIRETIEAGNKIGIKGNDTLQAVSSLMQMEQTRSGAVSGSVFDRMRREQEALGDFDKHSLGGSKSLGVMNAAGNNHNAIFQGAEMASLLSPTGLTGAGKAAWHDLPHNKALDSLPDYEKAQILMDSPEYKRTFGAKMLQGSWGKLPPIVQRHLMGLDGQSILQADSYLAVARHGFKPKKKDGSSLGSDFNQELNETEHLSAYGGQVKEIATSGASEQRLMGLLQWEAEKAKAELEASKTFSQGVDNFGGWVSQLTAGSWIDRAKAGFGMAFDPGGTVRGWMHNDPNKKQ